MKLPAAHMLILFTAINLYAQDSLYGSAEGEYSCYTLWNIAQGELKDSLQQKTISLLNESLVKILTDAQQEVR